MMHLIYLAYLIHLKYLMIILTPLLKVVCTGVILFYPVLHIPNSDHPICLKDDPGSGGESSGLLLHY